MSPPRVPSSVAVNFVRRSSVTPFTDPGPVLNNLQTRNTNLTNYIVIDFTSLHFAIKNNSTCSWERASQMHTQISCLLIDRKKMFSISKLCSTSVALALQGPRHISDASSLPFTTRLWRSWQKDVGRGVTSGCYLIISDLICGFCWEEAVYDHQKPDFSETYELCFEGVCDEKMVFIGW